LLLINELKFMCQDFGAPFDYKFDKVQVKAELMKNSFIDLHA